VDGAEQAQREAERAALRNVRKALDQLEASEAQRRRLLRKVAIACAALLVFGALLVWALFFSGERMPKGAPVQVPDHIKFRPS
jgi:ferric-dicitrate binding protein FerR (iron transport regulator)